MPLKYHSNDLFNFCEIWQVHNVDEDQRKQCSKCILMQKVVQFSQRKLKVKSSAQNGHL